MESWARWVMHFFIINISNSRLNSVLWNKQSRSELSKPNLYRLVSRLFCEKMWKSLLKQGFFRWDWPIRNNSSLQKKLGNHLLSKILSKMGIHIFFILYFDKSKIIKTNIIFLQYRNIYIIQICESSSTNHFCNSNCCLQSSRMLSAFCNFSSFCNITKDLCLSNQSIIILKRTKFIFGSTFYLSV